LETKVEGSGMADKAWHEIVAELHLVAGEEIDRTTGYLKTRIL